MSRIKKALSIILVGVSILQLTGCKSADATELKTMIESGETIEVMPVAPSTYSVSEEGLIVRWEDYERLDELKTHRDSGFRQEFEKIFYINVVTDKTEGDSKQGSLYTVNIDGQDMRSGKVCLADAFRNKVFIEKYWSDPKVIDNLNTLAGSEYEDIDKTSSYAIYAAINAYYSLLKEYSQPNNFNPTAPMRREEFYSLVYKTHNRDTDINYNASEDEYVKAIGEESDYSKYAGKIQQYAWLNTENLGLDTTTKENYITRVEAIYLLIKMNFPDIYEQMTDTSASYSDAKSNGDMAEKLGFRDGKTGVELPRWTSYTLNYMIRNPDKGMQSELYKATAAAYILNIINDSVCRWNEPVSRAEAIELIINSLVAMNKQYGYLSTTEYAQIAAPVELAKPEIPEDIMARIGRLTEAQIEIFEKVASTYEEELSTRKMTQEEVDIQQMLDLNDAGVEAGVIMKFVQDLFPYWKYLKEYTDVFPSMTIIGGALAGEQVDKDKQANKDKLNNHTISVTIDSTKLSNISGDIALRINNLTDIHNKLFDLAAQSYKTEQEDESITEEEITEKQLEELNKLASDNGVDVSKIIDLFNYWKYLYGYIDEIN